MDTFCSICGAPKAGTTSLYQYLDAHPDICMSRPKETGYFFESYDEALDGFWENHFDHCTNPLVVGEASAGNMLHDKVAARLSKHFEDARLIFVLRDPVERLYSHYRFALNIGSLPPTTDFSRVIRDTENEWRHTMVELGMYCEQLQRYAAYFSRDQMRIFLFTELVNETDAVVRDCFEFVGVDPSVEVRTDQTHNETYNLKYPELYRLLYSLWAPLKNRLPESAMDQLMAVRSTVRGLFFQSERQASPELDPRDRRYLAELYADPNTRLQEWLARDLSHWTGMQDMLHSGATC
jgi:hypothetical protein